MKNIKLTALTIGGSDCSGGAGIQADLKTFTVHKVYGASLITNITAQNTTGLQNAEPVSNKMIISQWRSLVSDLHLKFIKLGMLGDEHTISAIGKLLTSQPNFFYIVDPVMISKSGFPLLNPAALTKLKDKIISCAYLVTPNLFEAEVLAGHKIRNVSDMEQTCLKIINLGAENVLIKGGHLNEAPIDILYMKQTEKFYHFTGKRQHGNYTHGTGCSLSAAITANLTLGLDLPTAINNAKKFVNNGIKDGIIIGRGINPINFNNGGL